MNARPDSSYSRRVASAPVQARSAATRRAPASSKPWLNARPMPRAAPVTTATIPSKSGMALLLMPNSHLTLPSPPFREERDAISFLRIMA